MFYQSPRQIDISDNSFFSGFTGQDKEELKLFYQMIAFGMFYISDEFDGKAPPYKIKCDFIEPMYEVRELLLNNSSIFSMRENNLGEWVCEPYADTQTLGNFVKFLPKLGCNFNL